MEYTFTDRDLFKEPNTYMYPPYGGRDFLLAWSEQRLRAVADMDSHCSASGAGKELERLRGSADMSVFRAILTGIAGTNNADEANAPYSSDTTALLEELWARPVRSLSGEGAECVLAMIRRFEVSKKFPETAVFPAFSMKNGAPLLSVAPYALFSGILAYRQSERFSPAELNCLLKVNDLATSRFTADDGMRGMEPRHYDALKIGVLSELFLVRRLLSEKEYAAF